jgi:aspartyl-tRNA(Asn)/glutamyl-tRNA(Gln) amidotransferase subunit B
MNYQMVVGLEVHVQLKTQTKLFCGCSTQFGAPPNSQVCPVCLGLPGALPVINQEAIRLAIRTGLALGSRIPEETHWDRKNYFYPDLPKGYQTSQFDQPICQGGQLTVGGAADGDEVGSFTVRLVRAHLEEDAGKSLHDERTGTGDTRIDLNRAGTPLLEIVTQPDLRSAQQAKEFLEELRLLLTFLDVSDCNMQEGSLRADANVNLHLESLQGVVATPITEIKNLNSFRAVERAILYEAERQWQQWQRDGRVLGEVPKQTRGWDDQAGVTTLQREKEDAADYRYFPCPDLMPVRLTAEVIERQRREIGESPEGKRRRYIGELGIKPYDAQVIVAQGRGVCDYFDRMVQMGAPARRASAWMQQDVLRYLKEQRVAIDQFPVDAERLAMLLGAIESGKIDTTRGREIFQLMQKSAQLTVEEAIGQLGLESVDQDTLESLCQQLLADNPEVVAKVRQGNAKALGSLVGQARKANPNADPRQVQELCLRLIERSAGSASAGQ